MANDGTEHWYCLELSLTMGWFLHWMASTSTIVLSTERLSPMPSKARYPPFMDGNILFV